MQVTVSRSKKSTAEIQSKITQEIQTSSGNEIRIKRMTHSYRLDNSANIVYHVNIVHEKGHFL